MGTDKASSGVRVRKSNIELLRIIAMIMILGVHCNFLALDQPSHSEFELSPLRTALRYFLQYACVVGVNIFVMISGYFGIKLTIKRLLSYCFYLFYWAIIVCGILWVLNQHYHFLSVAIPLGEFVKGLSDGSMWFVIAYLILMILSIPLNTFLKEGDNKAIGKFLLLYFALELILRRSFGSGYSPLSFIGIYVLGGFIARNIKAIKGGPARYFMYYIAILVMMTIVVILARYIFTLPPRLSTLVEFCMIAYSGPFNILGAAVLLIAFAKMDFHIPLINYVAASAFGVYLLHMSPVVYDTYLDWCRHIYNNYSLLPYAGMLAATFIAIFVFVTIVDQGRKYLSKILFK